MVRERPLEPEKPQSEMERHQIQASRTRRTAFIAILAALCISTNYVMLPLPNVKLMDVIVFSVGLSMGILPAVAIASVAWLVYGTLNPLGLAIPILITVVLCENIYALAARFLGKKSIDAISTGQLTVEQGVVLGTLGLFSTLTYDVITNAVSGVLAYNSVWVGLLTMNVPFPLGIIHEASNSVFFAVITPLLLKLLRKARISPTTGFGKLRE